MAYDPADLRLPGWLISLLNRLTALRLWLPAGWRFGMTRPGWILIAAIAGLWAAALYSGNNLLYLCGAMLTALCSVAIWQGYRLLKRFPDPIAHIPLLEAGSVTVVRARRESHWPDAAVVEIHCDQRPGPFTLLARCEQQGMRIDGRINPLHRGCYDNLKLSFSSSAPLGLFILQRSSKSDLPLLVMPRSEAWHQRSGRDMLRSQFDYISGSDSWHDLRAYMPGDPLTRVHWRKATHNIGEWRVKRFADPGSHSAEALLRVDLRLPSGTGLAAFEQLLGKVWFWIQENGSGAVIVAGHRYELDDQKSLIDLQYAIAAATPENTPPAGEGGILLAVECDA